MNQKIWNLFYIQAPIQKREKSMNWNFMKGERQNYNDKA